MSALLNNSNTGVRVWYDGAISTGQFTFTAKVRIPTRPTQAFTPLLVVADPSGNQLYLHLAADGQSVRVDYNWGASSAAVGTYTAGDWASIAIVGDGTALRGYIGAATAACTQAARSILQVRAGNNFDYGATGARFADLRVFSAALSASEVAAEFASATPVATGSLVGDFPLASSLDARTAAGGMPTTAAAHGSGSVSTTPSISFSGDSPTYAPVAPAGPLPTISISSATMVGNQIAVTGVLYSADVPSISVSGFGPAPLGPVSATLSGTSWSATLTATAPPTSTSQITVTATITDANGSARATSSAIPAAGLTAVFYPPSLYEPSALVIAPAEVTLNAGGGPVAFLVTDDSGTVADGVSLSYSRTMLAPAATDSAGGFSVSVFDTPGVVTITATMTVPAAVGSRTVTGQAKVTVISGAPIISSTSLPAGQIGAAYEALIVVTGSPTSYSLAGLPPGLGWEVAPGGIRVTGQPTASGTFSVVPTATNSAGTTVGAVLSLVISGAGGGASTETGNTEVVGPAPLPVLRTKFAATQLDFVAATQALLPTGPAWPREPQSAQTHLVAGLAASQKASFDYANLMLDDVFPAGTTATLPEWEATLGLPDPCAGPSPTIERRRAQVIARLIGVNGQSIDDIVGYARNLGYDVAIREDAPFRCGWNSCADPIKGEAWAHSYAVRAALHTVSPFRCTSGCGDPLNDWGNDVLECELAAIKPAHSVLNFEYF